MSSSDPMTDEQRAVLEGEALQRAVAPLRALSKTVDAKLDPRDADLAQCCIGVALAKLGVTVPYSVDPEATTN